MIRRTTVWQDTRLNTVQVEVALLDRVWEPLAAVVEQVGPFDDWRLVAERAQARAEQLARVHFGQQALWDD